MSNITKIHIKNPVIIFFLGFLISLTSLATEKTHYSLLIPPDQEIKVSLAIDPKEQKQGLSGVKPKDFKLDEGMLFCFEKPDVKVFWMPDTWFNLDIFFLNSDLIVLDIERNMPFHKGYNNPKKIPRTRPIVAQYVLEMKADSPIAKKINIGMKLKWSHSKDLNQTISDAHRLR